MKEIKIILEPANIDYLCYFFGTKEEQAAADARKAARAAELERILFAANFIAAEYINSYGQKRILHKSTRPGVVYQLSYIDPDGVPAMHENYINNNGNPEEVGHIGTAADLITHYTNASNEKPLILRVLTA